ncbi:hypothetical protein LCDV1gp020 [Lymphocystis disease virus 1]|uniref:hypothetical protein n=1 Tax=Fish lymphocystis disease virus TaxID=36363 RepID=UPI0000161EFC|nr:hypothetical protein LCDV1gp020 [Lymphocystis disease virus 1]
MDNKTSLLHESISELTEIQFNFFKINLQIITPTIYIPVTILRLSKLELIVLFITHVKEDTFQYFLTALKLSGFLYQYDRLSKNYCNALLCRE